MKTANIISKADETQSDKWDFPVFQEELKTSRGIGSGTFAVIRDDTGEVVGEYKGIKVLPNTELIASVETGLRSAGIKFQRDSFLTTKHGSRFFARYSIGKMDIAGEKYGQKLIVGNSYDGTMKPFWQGLVERMACFNGMAGLSSAFNINEAKHSTGFDLAGKVLNMLNGIETSAKASKETIENMLAIQLNDTQADNVLCNLVAKGDKFAMAEKHAVLIRRNWQLPSDDEKPLGNTLYRLYNAATRYTRDIALNNRFELSHRTNLYIGDAFGLALRQKSFDKTFLVPSQVKIDFSEYALN